MGARCEPACGGVGPVEAGRLTGAHSSPFLNLGNVSHHTRHLLPENINSQFKDQKQNKSEKRNLFMRAYYGIMGTTMPPMTTPGQQIHYL